MCTGRDQGSHDNGDENAASDWHGSASPCVRSERARIADCRAVLYSQVHVSEVLAAHSRLTRMTHSKRGEQKYAVEFQMRCLINALSQVLGLAAQHVKLVRR